MFRPFFFFCFQFISLAVTRCRSLFFYNPSSEGRGWKDSTIPLRETLPPPLFFFFESFHTEWVNWWEFFYFLDNFKCFMFYRFQRTLKPHLKDVRWCSQLDHSSPNQIKSMSSSLYLSFNNRSLFQFSGRFFFFIKKELGKTCVVVKW